jgi:hypothetical protein
MLKHEKVSLITIALAVLIGLLFMAVIFTNSELWQGPTHQVSDPPPPSVVSKTNKIIIYKFIDGKNTCYFSDGNFQIQCLKVDN